MTWTAERVDELRRLAESGLSAAQIRDALSLTRNTVIGKCRREGILLRGTVGVHTARKPVAKPKPVRMPKLRAAPKPKAGMMPKRSALSNQIIRGPSDPIPFDMRAKPGDPAPIGRPGEFEGCKWIALEPTALAVCCGRVRSVGSAYCPTHRMRCENVPTRRSALHMENVVGSAA